MRFKQFWRKITCRRILNWSPLIIIVCMLTIQVVLELRTAPSAGDNSITGGSDRFKIIDRISNVFVDRNCPKVRTDNVDLHPVPNDLSLDTIRKIYSEEETLRALPYPPLDAGGSWAPKNCTANYRVAIVIPFRDRYDQLPVLLYYLHQILQRQLIDYWVFVVEQHGNTTFNKALMMNVGFDTVRKLYPKYDCFTFHDVDMIPEEDRNAYHCGRFPRHLSSAVDEFNYTLPYPQIAGGVLAMTVDQFTRANGYSNMYWGWGAEDDDMYYRIKASGMLLVRPPLTIGRYTMLKHEKRTRWNESIHLLVKALSRFRKDGLNRLSNIPYTIVHVQSRLLYTHILVSVTPPGDTMFDTTVKSIGSTSQEGTRTDQSNRIKSTPEIDQHPEENISERLEVILDQMRGD